MNATIRSVLTLGLALSLAACVGAPARPGSSGRLGEPGAPDNAGAQPSFEGLKGTWVLSALKESTAVSAPGFEAPTLIFGARYGEASGSGGCNGYGSRYTLDADGGISFGEFWSTKMFCVDAPAETAYFALLPKVRRYMFSGSRLALLEEDGTLLALFERAKP